MFRRDLTDAALRAFAFDGRDEEVEGFLKFSVVAEVNELDGLEEGRDFAVAAVDGNQSPLSSRNVGVVGRVPLLLDPLGRDGGGRHDEAEPAAFLRRVLKPVVFRFAGEDVPRSEEDSEPSALPLLLLDALRESLRPLFILA